MQLLPEDKLILSVVKIYPSSIEIEQINDFIPQIKDWDYLIATIIDRGIGPLLYQKLPLLSNSWKIPYDVKRKLQQVYYKTFSRSTILYHHFRKIAEAFTLQGIPVIVLKGIYLSENLYQDIGLRQFSDIDLLVKVEDGPKCIEILSSIGFLPFEFQISEFVKNKSEIIHYAPMMSKGVSVEIHIKLHSELEQYDFMVDELWSNAIPVHLNGINVLSLNTTDLLIHLCLHLDKHFKGGHVQFTCFNDITNLLEKYSETIEWTEFTKLCRFYNCENTVYLYIVMVHKFMSATVPSEILKKYCSLLTEKENGMFCKYLKGYKYSMGSSRSYLNILKDSSAISHKFRFFWGILFPSKVFIFQRYRVKHPSLVLFYYPYRYYIGLRGMVHHFFCKK